ncbi:YopX family protein [Paenibacillus sp. FSL R7-0333]|uniref:YopX family protein n=1 Tax=Paenibacillus sp. FSL R7-0333 TaxID=1926587 RepID=UPI00096C7C77|nr:hypothetical protein BK146_16975 [Paenibacillus sp. FSL R7-0333]
MSSKPKYRAWYKPLGVMIEPDKLEMINFETEVLGVYLIMDGWGYHKLRISDFELMPYSETKERNGEGAELFVGDIVVSDQYPIREEDGYVGVIEYDKGVFWLTHRMKAGSEVRGLSDSVAYFLYEHKNNNLRRIGNIHHNPELLSAEVTEI